MRNFEQDAIYIELGEIMKKGSSKLDPPVIAVLRDYPEGLTRKKLKPLVIERWGKEKFNVKNSNERRLTESLQRLEKADIIKKKKDWIKGEQVDVFHLIELENLLDINEAKYLMDSYNNSKRDGNFVRTQELQREIEHCFLNFNVRDPEFIKFVIKEANRIEDNTHLFRKSIGHLVKNLYKAIDINKNPIDFTDKDLLDLTEQCLPFFHEIIFNKNKPIIDRLETLDIIRQYDTDQKFDVAFQLLTTVDCKHKIYDKNEIDKLRGKKSSSYVFMKDDKKELISEYEVFKEEIENLIMHYAERDPEYCKKQLHKLLSPKTDVVIARTIEDMLSKIRHKSIEKKESSKFSISPTSFDNVNVTPSRSIIRSPITSRTSLNLGSYTDFSPQEKAILKNIADAVIKNKSYPSYPLIGPYNTLGLNHPLTKYKNIFGKTDEKKK